MTLDELRQQLDQLDGELLSLIARRQAIAREVAAAKRSTGYPTRDYQREREVILGVRRRAEALGLPGDLAENVLRLLIRSSLTTQERPALPRMARAVVVVRWSSAARARWAAGSCSSCCRRASTCRWPIPPALRRACQSVADWRTLPDLDDFDFIVVATPLGAQRRDPQRTRAAASRPAWCSTWAR